MNMLILGKFTVIFAVILGFSSYLLARRKTDSPVLAGLVGAILALLPPVGIMYLGLLITKKDMKPPID